MELALVLCGSCIRLSIPLEPVAHGCSAGATRLLDANESTPCFETIEGLGDEQYRTCAAMDSHMTMPHCPISGVESKCVAWYVEWYAASTSRFEHSERGVITHL